MFGSSAHRFGRMLEGRFRFGSTAAYRCASAENQLIAFLPASAVGANQVAAAFLNMVIFEVIYNIDLFPHIHE